MTCSRSARPRFGGLMVLALLAACGAILAGQQSSSPNQPASQPRPTFKSVVDAVVVDVRVEDAGGTFVRDLTAGDFRIVEEDYVTARPVRFTIAAEPR